MATAHTNTPKLPMVIDSPPPHVDGGADGDQQDEFRDPHQQEAPLTTLGRPPREVLEWPVSFEPPNEALDVVWQASLLTTAHQQIAGLERVHDDAGDEKRV
jgi:hypothetical protein